jgi:hypothetical protein
MFRGLSQELSQDLPSPTQGEGEKMPEAVRHKMEAALEANNDPALEHEADVLGQKAAAVVSEQSLVSRPPMVAVQSSIQSSGSMPTKLAGNSHLRSFSRVLSRSLSIAANSYF